MSTSALLGASLGLVGCRSSVDLMPAAYTRLVRDCSASRALITSGSSSIGGTSIGGSGVGAFLGLPPPPLLPPLLFLGIL